MSDFFTNCQRVFREGGITVTPIRVAGKDAFGFEGVTVLGFLFLYPDSAALLSNWRSDLASAIHESQFGLRRAKAKAWNTYAVILSEGAASLGEQVLLRAIEEDLVGTRKIAQGGIIDSDSLRQALLPLLPLQHAPRLEAVDMAEEIRLRTTELPARVVNAFLSDASDEVLAQILEDEQ